jgi:creatinine amidohydrolase/Fe(II)-dependent formamide hydrolase-like protein
MLAVRPDLVQLDRARTPPATARPGHDGLVVHAPDQWLRIDGFSDDPRDATAAAGEEMLTRCVAAAAAAIEEIAAQ